MKKNRKKLVAGNWKMNKALGDAQQLASDIKRELADCREVDVVLCPPFTALKVVSDAIESSLLKLGAQNMHWEAQGAYTGEISPGMLRDLYCHYVILGHSERRMYFGETDAIVNRKVKAALSANLIPIVCVGETLAERDGDLMREVVERQVRGALDGVELKGRELLVAYEPVWAIGTGRTASPEQAQEVHAFIRDILGSVFTPEIASGVRILYGGSMKPDNAAALMGQGDIDGGLIGGASLKAPDFLSIIAAAS